MSQLIELIVMWYLSRQLDNWAARFSAIKDAHQTVSVLADPKYFRPKMRTKAGKYMWLLYTYRQEVKQVALALVLITL